MGAVNNTPVRLRVELRGTRQNRAHRGMSVRMLPVVINVVLAVYLLRFPAY